MGKTGSRRFQFERPLNVRKRKSRALPVVPLGCSGVERTVMSGPRRHTLREAALSGPEMLRKHRQRYGTKPSAADRTTDELGAPSAWLDADGRAAWRRVVAAPPDLLRAIDTGMLEALAVAMVRHQRWATLLQQVWQRAPIDP